ncbi:MAG: succinyl-diaminopimelate desuccinylase [Porticoccaceae bacterium]|jgi:succinyl-diaminopimelate desuccinylase
MTVNSPTLALAMDLVSRPSVTPLDHGCQELMLARLEACGFSVERLKFDDVDNFWAVHGSDGPIFCFAGHTDVVPTGPVEQWTNLPFTPVIKDGLLFARGSADMKGSLAAMVVAAEQFVAEYPEHPGRLAFLITSDEEGIAINGTVRVVQWLEEHHIIPQWCLVGEPSSSEKCGDTIKNGRRGSLGCSMTIKGLQGHVAYPHLASNPIHLANPAINELINEVWDKGNQYFPPTSFQISNVSSGTGATNVIPGDIKMLFNFRFSTEVTEVQLRQRVEDILDKHGLNYSMEWRLSGEPFLTATGLLVDVATQCIEEVTGLKTLLSTAGGTSDGRFIAPMGTEVVELGPLNSSIHRVDEHVSIDDLEKLTKIYQKIVSQLLC